GIDDSAPGAPWLEPAPLPAPVQVMVGTGDAARGTVAARGPGRVPRPSRVYLARTAAAWVTAATSVAPPAAPSTTVEEQEDLHVRSRHPRPSWKSATGTPSSTSADPPVAAPARDPADPDGAHGGARRAGWPPARPKVDTGRGGYGR